jgi:UDP-N-acetylglucosamine acyltransferase
VYGLNTVGLARRGFSAETRALLKKAYMILYRSGLNVTQALERIESELPRAGEIATLVDFIRDSARGIIK